MPTYEYICEACGDEFEKFQQMSAAPIRKCPKCGKNKVQRKISVGGGIIFKGGGFYETDYRGDAYKKAADADKPGEAKPAETKADATPASNDATAVKAEAPKPAAAPSDAKPTETKATSEAKPQAKTSSAKTSSAKASSAKSATSAKSKK